MSASIRFGVLGPLAAWKQGVPVTPRGATQRILLAALLLAEGETVSAAGLADLIWPDAPPKNPRLSVQVAVSRLRTWLEQLGASVDIAFTGVGYRLETPPETVDVSHFRALHAAAAGAPAGKRVVLLAEALRQWRGPVLGDGPDVLRDGPAPAALERLRCAVAAELADAALDAGEPEAALSYLEELAPDRPLDEPLHAALALTLAGCGRQADALSVLDALRARLADELGVDPGPQLREAHLRVLRQDVLREPEPAAAPTGPRWRGPQGHLSTLIGRSEQEKDLGEMLANRRLVTLVGPGGCGKTSLALHVARQVADRFADGVTVAPLASLAGADEIVMALGALLGAGAQSVGEVRLALAHSLRESRMLLILDNCEHVSRESADTVRWLLGAAPGLRVLATSRQPLQVAEECVAPLEPLPVPLPGCRVDPAMASVALFLRRAKEALPSFRASEGDLAQIGQLCRRLDGLPLALELAAARVRALTIEQLTARLNGSLDVLADRGDGREPRHVTLRSTVDWSFQLLDEAERTLLARLSVFGDSFTVEAAEEVCADELLPAHDVLPVLVALVDKSLVTPYDVNGGRRFRLLVAVAELAAERLAEAGCAAAVADRHLDHWLAHARTIDGVPKYNERAEMCRVLAADLGNVRAALNHGLATGREADVAEVLARLFTVWMVNSAYLGEGGALLQRALAAGTATPEVQALGEYWRGMLLVMREDYVGAQVQWLRASAALAPHRSREHHITQIAAITTASYLLDPAAVHDVPAMLAAVGEGDRDEPSTALTAGGSALVKWGRYTEATELTRRYAARAARRGMPFSASQDVLRMEIALGLGDLGEARARREILLGRLDQIDDPPEREPARRAIATYHLLVGEPAVAREFAAEAIRDLRRLLPAGMTRDAHLLILLAEAQRRTGDLAGAHASLLEALSRSLGRSRFHTGVLGVLAAALLAASMGREQAAKELATEWDATRRSLGLPVPLGFEEPVLDTLGLDPRRPPLPQPGAWHPDALFALIERAHAWCAAP